MALVLNPRQAAYKPGIIKIKNLKVSYNFI